MLLEGRRILLTGAARGIGLAAAQACRQFGAEVWISDIDAPVLERESAQLGVEACAMDVNSDRSIADAVARIDAACDGLDALVNNAAILDVSDTQSVSMERWRLVLETNLTSALRVTQAMLPLLRKGREPAIVNTVSTQAFFGQPASVAYASAKGGLLNLTRSMAVDLGSEGIRVNAVAPGFIDTRMALLPDGRHEHEEPAFKEFYLDQGRIPLRRPGTPQDCAGAFVFLVSTMSRYITGQTIIVDGGLSASY